MIIIITLGDVVLQNRLSILTSQVMEAFIDFEIGQLLHNIDQFKTELTNWMLLVSLLKVLATVLNVSESQRSDN